MTYVSNWIEIKSDPPELDPDKIKTVVDGFPSPHDRYGPYALQAWAQKHDFEIEYIDNCWLRVEVSAVQLREFWEELYPHDPAYVSETMRRISPTESYVIVAEEF